MSDEWSGSTTFALRVLTNFRVESCASSRFPQWQTDLHIKVRWFKHGAFLSSTVLCLSYGTGCIRATGTIPSSCHLTQAGCGERKVSFAGAILSRMRLERFQQSPAVGVTESNRPVTTHHQPLFARLVLHRNGFFCTARFVVMAIELAFSLTVGVSCLVFSLNLVRKLREEDPDSIRPGYRSGGTSRGSSSGYYYSTSAMHGDAVVGPGVVRAAGVGTGRDTVGKSGTEYMRGGGGGGGGGSGGTSVAVMGRGIGSILTRNSNSQMEMYDSEEELEYTFPRQDNGRSGKSQDVRAILFVFCSGDRGIGT